ncbi:MAG: hypothetical protein V2B15_06235 [Bacteroidota bacterium]
MKKILIVLFAIFVCVLFVSNIQAQNTFPPTGYVGIGTLTPTEDLHIFNSTTAVNCALESSYTGTGSQVIGRYRIRNAGTGDLYYIGLRTTNGVREAIQSIKDGITNTWLEFIYLNVNTRKYEFRNGINDAEFLNSGKILFNNTGGVGIGVTTIPTGVKLAVNGKVNCKEVEVTLTGWSDHVFNKNYSLMPLSEVENFITANKHLPGIPSEKEVLESGINLGNMDALLLQKIEELTLYVIDLKKENEALKAKIDEIVK